MKDKIMLLQYYKSILRQPIISKINLSTFFIIKINTVMKIKPILIIIFLTMFALTAYSQSFKKGPYLILSGVNTEMKVLWQNTGISTDQISWGTDLTYSMGTSANPGYGSDFQHLQTITGLTPGTKYYYKVIVNGVTKTGSFYTPPTSSATATKFLVYGDTRTNPNYHNDVATRINATATADPGYQSVLLSVGDLVSAGYNETPWTSEFFNYAYPEIMNMLATIPYESAVGNHEFSGSTTLFNKYFPYNFQGGRYYYSFDYGPAHFAVVDQYTAYTVGSSQYNWLVSDLSASTKPWKFIILHEPGWSAAGGHANNTTVQNVIEPLCVQYNVPIVFAGHNHYYARAAVPEAGGITIQHVTAGAAGAPLYTPDNSQPNIVSSAKAYHFCKISIESDYILKFEAINSDGTLIDQFTISRNIPVTGVTVSPTSLSLLVGETGQLTSTVLPANATNKTVVWSTSNSAIATVNSSGLVKTVSSGNAIITVTTADGGFTATCSVTVNTPPVITYYVPNLTSILTGTLKSGGFGNLDLNDGSYYVINSKTPKPFVSDWYGRFNITENPENVIRLTVNYDGKYSSNVTQELSMYNFSTNAWVQFNSKNVGKTDISTTYIQNTPSNFISSAGEIRVRVYASNNSKNYTCSGDWMQIKVESVIPPPIIYNSVDEIPKPDIEAVINEFEAYPNPAGDKVTFRVNLSSVNQGDIIIYNSQGVKAATVANNSFFKSGMNEIDFNTSGLNSGIYICKLRVKSISNGIEEKTLKLSIKK